MGKAVLSEFRIFETNEFLKQLEKFSNQDNKFIHQKLYTYVYPQLKKEPFYGVNIKKLRGYSPDTWRYRIGSYRLFYIVNKKEKIISIISIDARENAYRKQ